MTNQIQTKLRRKLANAKAKKGFSLVELLVVIAVIGIIAAIAIPNIAGITNSAGNAKNMRNAQSIASMFAAAKAVGWDPSAANPVVSDPTTSITALTTGVTVGTGATAQSFKVPMSAADITALEGDTVAMSSLKWDAPSNNLEYTHAN